MADKDSMPVATKTRFGTLFRKFRKRAGLSHHQLAGYLGAGKINGDRIQLRGTDGGQEETPKRQGN
jgi:hypothetical protein